MEHPVTVIKHPTILGDYQIAIWHDSNPIDPRSNDNLGTIACWHRRYTLGDEQISGDVNEWLAGLVGIDINDDDYSEMTLKEVMSKVWTAIEERYVILPVYIYDHSGITISTGKFSCQWDSGQVGFIYYDKQRNEHEGYTPEWLEKHHKGKSIDQVIADMLRAEIKEYDQYLTGDVYGFEIFRPDEDITLGSGGESCWGFFGYNEWKDNGLLDDAIGYIDSDVKERLLQRDKQLHNHIAYLKSMIKQHIPISKRKSLKLSY